MFAILPLLALILLYLIFYQKGNEWRNSVLLAALTWGFLVAFITEALSIFQWLTFLPLLFFWGLTDVFLVLTYLKTNQKSNHVKPILFPKSPFLIFLLCSIVAIVTAVGLIALIAPPNNWDSMTYHMGRVVHWIQNRSVAHYPTHIIRQLYSGPWAGYAITHLQILSGGDRFANLIQWFSMAGSTLGVSLIAAQLGANLRGQIFAAVICATIPMGILQGSSTQTDYVVSFWLVCFAYFVLLTIQDKMSWKHIPAVGASLGLALLSKGTAYVYAFPFCLWLGLTGIRRLKWQVWKPVLTIGAITLAVNFGYYQRNFKLFGSVLGASDGQGNKEFGLALLISNIIRNLALHLSTPVRSLNLVTIRFIELLHKLLGLDVSDPRITSPPGQNFDLHSLINHEDLAGNPLHLLLILASAIYFFAIYKHFKSRERYFLSAYLLAIGTAFILFCALVLWSPWRSRVHLPLFVLASAFVGVILSRAIIPRVGNFIAISLVGFSLIWVLFNESRPIILNSRIIETHLVENIFNRSRVEQYFANKPELQQPYMNAVRFVRAQECSQIGLSLGSDTWEYPLWVLLQKDAEQSLQIKHTNIGNVSTGRNDGYSQIDFIPCAVIASEIEAVEADKINAKNHVYVQRWVEKPLSIFLSNTDISNRE